MTQINMISIAATHTPLPQRVNRVESAPPPGMSALRSLLIAALRRYPSASGALFDTRCNPVPPQPGPG
jgi:hypothetical protein